MLRDLFLFVPAYNVQGELWNLLNSIPSEVLLRTEEILIIDDGSSDKTLSLAEKFSREEIRARVSVASFSKNSGYGAVVKCGLLRALELSKTSDVKFAVCLHGDAQYPAKSIPQMLETFEALNAAAVQGSRHAERGSARAGKMPFYKILGGKFLTALENCVFTNKLTDRHSGFIGYRISALQNLDLQKFSESFDIDIEILAALDAQKQILAEIPIETRYAGEKSNLRVIPYGLRVLRIAFRRLRGVYG